MNDLGQLSLLAIYGAMAAYALAMVAFGIDLSALRDRGPTGRPRRAARIAMTTTTAGLALHVVAVLARGIAAGRVPWANMYEFTLVFTLVAVTTFLALQRWRDLRYLGALIITPTLLALGLAVSVFYVKADGVSPALDHYWLVIHVSVATMAIGVFAVAAALSVVQLVKDRGERKSAQRREPAVALAGGAAAGPVAGASAEQADRGFWGRLADVLPGAAELERLAYRLNAVAFLLWTFTLIAGAIWAEHAWGRPWGWDPKEVGTFVVWVTYAAYLHARATRGWDGRKAAYLGLFGFALVLVNYFVVNLFTETVHGYAF
ncbi:cytochrome c-type biogenesis protein CcsB [Georgenia satyanarayanai]|uniref:Cytochrome c-type biogenesis protein CcsB n=1 Tax=Georgenia satyanarayanai TaxID=860221 RepID=A0A2Y9AS18_9MICO|nr:c-type cytochrome biogenesis protein CcsB [Georgenia satyanarayanai]PYF96354.1 cytochrome c-type biogenesis protein CcsB [Georgenia satyanarayanai]SSA46885.1 cytochrome c-type biogenesis protein CcsB [Georgenia satyanarayanai]